MEKREGDRVSAGGARGNDGHANSAALSVVGKLRYVTSVVRSEIVAMIDLEILGSLNLGFWEIG